VRLLVAGGGTGGHLFPGIALAQEAMARDPRSAVLFVGTAQGLENASSRSRFKLGSSDEV
jgi:UDP-N-acetylglucosamine--N-acetylmuramyl-(pentapeptide) pyrophosphoryl-undecaprenol N-acetylglucosamine transferase